MKHREWLAHWTVQTGDQHFQRQGADPRPALGDKFAIVKSINTFPIKENMSESGCIYGTYHTYVQIQIYFSNAVSFSYETVSYS